MASVDLYAELMQPGEPPNPLLYALRSRPPWMVSAACRGKGVDFFPAAPRRGEAPDVGPALAICSGCPVADECRAYALREGVEGIWGGTSATERKVMRQAA
jgi:hypothetical protein